MLFSNYLSTVLQDVTIYDSYYFARKILNKYLDINLGIDLADLPDVCELTDITDNISEYIKDFRKGIIDEQTTTDLIQGILAVLDSDFIEFIILG